MPALYRGMYEENGKPKIGDGLKLLRVRVPPNPNPDIFPDAAGKVYPPTTSNADGMSCAPIIGDLPPFRRPVVWGGTEQSSGFAVGMIDEADLGSELGYSSTHAVIGPAREMAADEFRMALAATQSKWVMVLPCP